jgi:hypothetical protein
MCSSYRVRHLGLVVPDCKGRNIFSRNKKGSPPAGETQKKHNVKNKLHQVFEPAPVVFLNEEFGIKK